MKRKLIPISTLLFVACQGNNSANPSIIGSLYVTTIEGEFSRAADTIEITPLNPATGAFYFERRTAYRRISSGRAGPLQHRIEHTTCVFNTKAAQLTEQRHGRVYSMSADGSQLILGNSIYRRVQ